MSRDNPSYRILIVDDNQSIHDDFASILQPERNDNLADLEQELFGQAEKSPEIQPLFVIDHALQGRQGWEMACSARKEGKPYAMAFVDMRMPPGWDGLETIEHLLLDDPEIQAVICSAYSDYSWQDISHRIGVTDRLLILKKPADSMEIRQLAHSLCQKWQLQRQHADRMADLDLLVEEKTAELARNNQQLLQKIREKQQAESQLKETRQRDAVGLLAADVAADISRPVRSVAKSVHFLQSAHGEISRTLESYRKTCAVHLSTEQRSRLKRLERSRNLPDLEARIVPAFEEALQGIGRTSSIAQALRDFARPDGGEKRPIDINRAVETVLMVTRSEYKDFAELETKLEELPAVECHAGQINQALCSIVVNAAQAVNQAVDSADPSSRGHIRVSTRAVDEWVEIQVADSGTGIGPGIGDRIFEPDFSTRNDSSGRGQGLAIAREIIVDQHGGELSFDSIPDRGTTFYVRLPVDQSERAAA